MKNKLKSSPFIISIAILGILLCTLCSYQVKYQEAVIINKFGELEVVDQPGLYFKLPWPLQKTQRLDLRGQVYSGTMSEINTKDNILIICKLDGSWKISNVAKFYSSLGNFTEAKKQVASLVSSVRNSVLRNYPLSDFFGPGKLAKINAKILASTNAKSIEQYGIEFQFLSISQLKAHAKNSASILERMRQETLREAAQIKSTAEIEAQKIRNEADAKKAKAIALAKAEARKQEGVSLAKLTDRLGENPEDIDFIIFLRKLEALSQSVDNQSTLILDPNAPIFNIFQDTETIKQENKKEK